MFQGHTVLNLKHRDILLPIIVDDFLPDIKKQIEDNVVGWVGSFRLQPNSLRNRKLVFQIESYRNRNVVLETIQSPLILFTRLQISPIISKACR